jgi:hypothetical protein
LEPSESVSPMARPPRMWAPANRIADVERSAARRSTW